MIRHGGQQNWNFKFRPTHAAMPVRSLFFLDLSYKTRGVIKSHDDRNNALLDTLDLVNALKIPFRALSYEGIVERPAEHVAWLADWVGADVDVSCVDVSWIHDGNKKYRAPGFMDDDGHVSSEFSDARQSETSSLGYVRL
jgi:hypothetical protein